MEATLPLRVCPCRSDIGGSSPDSEEDCWTSAARRMSAGCMFRSSTSSIEFIASALQRLQRRPIYSLISSYPPNVSLIESQRSRHGRAVAQPTSQSRSAQFIGRHRFSVAVARAMARVQRQRRQPSLCQPNPKCHFPPSPNCLTAFDSKRRLLRTCRERRDRTPP